MKLRKFPSSLLLNNKNKKISSNKTSNNILYSKKNSQIFLKLPYRMPSQINLNKRAITSNNLNSKEKIIKYHKTNHNNSLKSLISKSNSDLRYKTDFGIYNNSPNCSMNIFLIKNNSKNEYNKISSNKNNIKLLSKNFSCRIFDNRAKSFELLKISNEDIFSEKNFKNKKVNDSLKTNKFKILNFSKSKNNFNTGIRMKDTTNNKKIIKKKNNNRKIMYNNICGLLSKKNKLKNELTNFSVLLDKYVYDSANINLYLNEKENINLNTNNHNKYNKNLLIGINNLNSNKNKRNNNRKIMYLDYQVKLTQPKYSLKKKINLPVHPYSKNINTEINQYLSKKNINLTESNILFDNKLISRIKKEDSSKILVPINLKKKNSYKNINNRQLNEINFFSDKSYGKNKSKINKNNNVNLNIETNINEYNEKSNKIKSYEGVEMGHFKIVKLIQENKSKILKNNE